MFQHEIIAYSQVFPALIQLQNTTEPLVPSIPKYYGGNYGDGSQKVVVVENLTDAGYKMSNFKKGLNIQECTVVMKELAKLHALSFNLKHSSFAHLQQQFDYRGLFSQEFFDNYRQFLKCSIEAVVKLVKKRIDDEDVIKRVGKLLTIDFEQIIVDACKPEEPFSFLCHGEPLGLNILFKYDNNGTLLDMKLIDFQCMRYSNPISDLGQFLYQTTEQSLRKQYMDQLLLVYYTTFRGLSSQLDVDLPDYTFEDFHALFNRKSQAWILLAIMYLPVHLSKPEDLPNFLDPNSDDVPNQFKTCIEKSGRAERLCDLVYEALETGLL